MGRFAPFTFFNTFILLRKMNRQEISCWLILLL